jgi:hypothetical protein
VNIESARVWSEALRSGKYRQCSGKMIRNDGFCCLGVAHEVLIGPVGMEVKASYEAVDAILDLSEAAETEFVALNDEDGKNFAEIADFIDERIAALSRQSTSEGVE